MKKAQVKDFLREIKKSLNRYLSIFFISALGVAFFAGVRSTEPDMRLTVDTYLDDAHFMDVRVISTLGLTDEDIKALNDIEGVSGVQGAYEKDLITETQDEQMVIHVMSIAEGMNEAYIIEGRLPQNAGECLADAALRNIYGFKTGDALTFKAADGAKLSDILSNDTYTITGFAMSPFYLTFQRGSTTIGNGSVSAFVMLDSSEFTQDYYNQIYVTSDDLKELNCYSDEYEDIEEKIKDRIDEISSERCQARFDYFYNDAKDTLLDGEKEYEKASKEADEKLLEAANEIESADAEIADGYDKLEDGRKELADKEEELKSGENELSDAKNMLAGKENELASNEQRLSAAEKELEASYEKLTSGQKEYDAGVKAFEAAKAEYESGEAEYNANSEALKTAKAKLDAGLAVINEKSETLKTAKAELDAGLNTINEKSRELNAAKRTLDVSAAMLEAGWRLYNIGLGSYEWLSQAQAEYDAGLKQYEEGAAALEEAKAKYDEGLKQYEAGAAALEEAKAEYDEGLKQYENGAAALDEAKGRLDEAKKQIDENEALLKASENELISGWQQYYAARSELEGADGVLKDARAELDNAAKQISDGEKELADGKVQLEDARQQIADGEKELKSGEAELENARAEYEKGVNDADNELKSARQELDEGWQEINKLEMPKWYILDRNTVQTYVEYGTDAERMGAIGRVFPVIFFLVAALVCLTTMTRMVEDERIQIGTYKALGYSTLAVSLKYIFYALSASVGGSILGALAGGRLFPNAIMRAYAMLYNNNPYMCTPLNLKFSVMAAVAAVFCTTAAAVAACYKALGSQAAQLMRPTAPKQGKKILLERIPFVWKRFNFSQKSTLRNLFRYKKRLFMTIFGIGACTALLVVGFGLRDAISAIVGNQFERVWLYEGTVTIDAKADEGELDKLDLVVSESPYIENSMRAYVNEMEAEYNNAVKSIYLFVPESMERFEDFVSLHDRISKEGYVLGDNEVIISEKLSKLLGLAVGDVFRLKESDTSYYDVKVGAVAESYVYHYVYMSPSLYENVFGEKPEYGQMLLNMTPDNEEQRLAAEKLLECKAVTSVGIVADTLNTMNKMMSSLDAVVWVLIISAGLLAFVVLYNLNNINITERIRELATIKVLGFYDHEVAGYVYRENVFLTLIGIAAGLIMGKYLQAFVVQTAEIDIIMFGRDISAASYALSILVTIVFAVIVNAVMYFRLKKIDMIESLKSVE